MNFFDITEWWIYGYNKVGRGLETCSDRNEGTLGHQHQLNE